MDDGEINNLIVAAMDEALERQDFLAKSIEAALSGQGVMVRVVDDELSAEIIQLSPLPHLPEEK